MRPRPIEVHIGELVLEGFPPAHRLRIGEALERELSRLLDAPATAARLVALGDRPSIEGGAFAPEPRATPDVVGAGAARSVYAGLTR